MHFITRLHLWSINSEDSNIWIALWCNAVRTWPSYFPPKHEAPSTARNRWASFVKRLRYLETFADGRACAIQRNNDDNWKSAVVPNWSGQLIRYISNSPLQASIDFLASLKLKNNPINDSRWISGDDIGTRCWRYRPQSTRLQSEADHFWMDYSGKLQFVEKLYDSPESLIVHAEKTQSN